MKTRIMGLVLCMMMVFQLVGCTSGSYSVLLANEKNTSNSISMKYSKFNGYKQTTLTLKENETVDVSVDIVTSEGHLDLSIIDENEQSAYQGTDIPTSSFKVTLDKAGKYKIKVSADNHSGSYAISWKTVQ